MACKPTYKELEKEDFLRKQIEEALRASEKKYRTMFESTQEAIMTADSDGMIISANPAAAKIFGFKKPEELIGSQGSERYADLTQREKLFEELFKKGFVKNYELTFKRADGTFIDVLGTATLYCVPSTKVVVGDTPMSPASCANSKPRELEFKYTGNPCSATTNSQGGKLKCSGDPAGASPVEVVLTKDADKMTVTPGTVMLNGSFSVASNDGRKLKNSIKLKVRKGGSTLKALEIHTSCSKPLKVGDQFGSLILQEFIPE